MHQKEYTRKSSLTLTTLSAPAVATEVPSGLNLTDVIILRGSGVEKEGSAEWKTFAWMR